MRIELHPFIGRCKGELRTLPLDVVVVERKDGTRRRIGFVPPQDGAVLRFTRCLRPEIREEIRHAVSELRRAEGKEPIADYTVGPPNPDKIRALITGKRKGTLKRKKTTVWTPEGADV